MSQLRTFAPALIAILVIALIAGLTAKRLASIGEEFEGVNPRRK